MKNQVNAGLPRELRRVHLGVVSPKQYEVLTDRKLKIWRSNRSFPGIASPVDHAAELAGVKSGKRALWKLSPCATCPSMPRIARLIRANRHVV